MKIVAPWTFPRHHAFRHTFRPPMLASGVELAGDHPGLLLTFSADEDRVHFGVRLVDGHHWEFTMANEPGDGLWPSRAETLPIVARFERVNGGAKLVQLSGQPAARGGGE